MTTLILDFTVTVCIDSKEIARIICRELGLSTDDPPERPPTDQVNPTAPAGK